MCPHGLSASLCSGFFGEPDSFSMYGSNRVKRRPSPYEMEITDGERIRPCASWGGGCLHLPRGASSGTMPHSGTKPPY